MNFYVLWCLFYDIGSSNIVVSIFPIVTVFDELVSLLLCISLLISSSRESTSSALGLNMPDGFQLVFAGILFSTLDSVAVFTIEVCFLETQIIGFDLLIQSAGLHLLNSKFSPFTLKVTQITQGSDVSASCITLTEAT